MRFVSDPSVKYVLITVDINRPIMDVGYKLENNYDCYTADMFHDFGAVILLGYNV